MPDFQLTLTQPEYEYLLDLLEGLLKDTQIEEHRTRSPSYRQLVLREETVIHQLLGKLRQSKAP